MDVQITGNDGYKLKNFNQNKVKYYRDNPCISDYILSNLNCTEVEFMALTVHYKDLVCKTSFKDCISNNILTKSHFKLVTDKVLLGSLICFKSFYRSTFK